MGLKIIRPEDEVLDPDDLEDDEEPDENETDDDAAAKMRRGHEDKQLARAGDKSAA